MNDRILVVDDEEGIRTLLGLRLHRLGYAHDKAANSQEALERLSANNYSLVLLDISMPNLSGRDLLPLITSKYPDTAVIMATAITDASTAIQCMKQGAYDYVNKPFDFDVLDASINRALEKRRLELENRDYKEHLEEKVKEQASQIRASFFNAITSLVYALEARDKYTSGHSLRVTESIEGISRVLNLDSQHIETLKLAGMVHDIGKIGIQESVLNKPGKLTHEEYQHIKTHPEIGSHILEPIVENQDIISVVRHHHERYDGKGYPAGLSAQDIPLGSRIISVADSFDAMTSARPYRPALGIDIAIKELIGGKGAQFDPVVVDAFLVYRQISGA